MDESDVAVLRELVDDVVGGIGSGGDPRTKALASFFASDAYATSEAVVCLSALAATGARVDRERLDEMARSLHPEPGESVRTRNLFVWALLCANREVADECVQALDSDDGYLVEGLAIAKAAGLKGAQKRMFKSFERTTLAKVDADDLDAEDRTHLAYLTGKWGEWGSAPTASQTLLARAYSGKAGDGDFITIAGDIVSGEALKRWLDSALVHALVSKRSRLKRMLVETYGRAARELACADGGISAMGTKSRFDLCVERAFATGSREDLAGLLSELGKDAERAKASEHAVLTPLALAMLDAGAVWPLMLKIEDGLIFKKILEHDEDVTFREIGLWLSCAVLLREELPERYLRGFATGFAPVTDEECAFKRRWCLGTEYAVALAGYCAVTEEKDAVSQLLRVVKESAPAHASSDDYTEYVMWLATSLYGIKSGEPPEAFLLDHVGRMCERYEEGEGLSDREVVELLMIRDALGKGRR